MVFLTLHQRNLNTQQSLVILDLCLRKSAGKSPDCQNVIVFEKLCFMLSFHAKTKTGVFVADYVVGIRQRLKISSAWCERGLTINSVSSEALSYSFFHRPS